MYTTTLATLSCHPNLICISVMSRFFFLLRPRVFVLVSASYIIQLYVYQQANKEDHSATVRVALSSSIRWSCRTDAVLLGNVYRIRRGYYRRQTTNVTSYNSTNEFVRMMYGSTFLLGSRDARTTQTTCTHTLTHTHTRHRKSIDCIREKRIYEYRCERILCSCVLFSSRLCCCRLYFVV